jgi:hypothetical protein
MTQYLISFGAHAMDHIPGEDAPAVARAAHATVQEAINAGVYVSAGGLENQPASIVATDGAVTDGPYPEAIGGFMLVEVPSREEALRWAAKIAIACRCAQEVREIGADPELDAMLRQADCVLRTNKQPQVTATVPPGSGSQAAESGAGTTGRSE